MHREPAIAAATEIRPGRFPELDALDLYARVVRAFLDEWRLDPSLVDGLLVAPAGMAIGAGADLCSGAGPAPASFIIRAPGARDAGRRTSSGSSREEEHQ